MIVLNNFILLCRLRWWVDVPVACGAPLAPRDEAGATVVVRRGLEFLAAREPVVADLLGLPEEKRRRIVVHVLALVYLFAPP